MTRGDGLDGNNDSLNRERGIGITGETTTLNSKNYDRYVTRNDNFKFEITRNTFGPRKGTLAPKQCTYYGTVKVVD